jgi:hypothetical protein
LLIEAVNGEQRQSIPPTYEVFEDGSMLIGQKEVVNNDDLFQIEDKISVVFESLGVNHFRLRLLDGPNGTLLSELTVSDLQTIPAPLCLLPSVLIVVVAVVSQSVVLALFAGLYLGGILIAGFNPIIGLLRAGDTFMVDALREADMGMLLFTWFMSGLVGIISRSGGALGIGRAFAHHATTAARAQVSLHPPLHRICTQPAIATLIPVPARRVAGAGVGGGDGHLL